MRMSPSTSNPIWVIQLKNEIGRDPLGPNGARLMAKTAVPVFGPLQRAEPEQEVGQVAQDDDDDHLGEREPERHEDGAVNEVLDLHAGAGPHAEDVPRRGPALAFGDEVDPVLFDLERIVDVRLVNDGQILGNRHRQYLLVVASARARTPRRATGGWAVAPAAPRQPPSVSRPRTHLSGPGARPWRATEGVVGPHNVGRRAPWSSGSCERCVNQLGRGWEARAGSKGPVPERPVPGRPERLTEMAPVGGNNEDTPPAASAIPDLLRY